jgi:hypothetical protein
VAGFAWIAFVAWDFLRSGDPLRDALGPLMATFPGLAFFGFGLNGLYLRRKRQGEAARYDTRASDRAASRRAFDTLAAEGAGSVETDGIVPAVRFLSEHHPDAAPTLLLHHQAGSDEDRLTLVGTIEGRRLLVVLVDSSAYGRVMRPPCLVVLVASPMATPPEAVDLPDALPFRKPGRRRGIEGTDAYGALVDMGMTVRWSPSGAYALHPGPFGPVDVAGLTEIARHVLDLCNFAPAESKLVESPASFLPDVDESDPEKVAHAFLTALRDRDGLTALALANPFLFPRGPREPTPAELDRVIEAARARPAVWKKSGVGSSGDFELRVAGQFGTRVDGSAGVHLTSVRDRWTVIGYNVDGEQVLGLPYEDPN